MSTQWLTFVGLIGSLILFHELGHFIAARLTGVRVDEFGLGFPPRLLTLFRAGGTRFTLNLIPLGGFVRPVGEDDPTVPGGLASASKRVRFAVVSAGALTNLIIAWLVLAAGFAGGWPDRVAISLVVEGSPAEQSGLLAGDVVLEADGHTIHYQVQLAQAVVDHLGEPLSLTVQRDSSELELVITPRTEWPEDQGPMGVELTILEVQYAPLAALVRAGQEVGLYVQDTLLLPSRILRGEIPLAAARPIGLVGLKQISDRAVEVAQQAQRWTPLIHLTAAISVALGVSNLLPLPALDGGRLMFILIEAVRGRRLSPEREGRAHIIGFVVLLTLMVVINALDILYPVVVR